MFSETPRMRSRWAASITSDSARRTPLVGQPLLLGGVELDLLDRRVELGLEPLARVPGDQRRMLADDVLLAQAGGLLLLVGRDVELGIGLQERGRDKQPSGLSPNSFSITAGSVPLRISGIRSATVAATCDFHSASIRAVFSSRCLARRLSRAVPTSGLSSVTSGSPRLTSCPSTTCTSRTTPAARAGSRSGGPR